MTSTHVPPIDLAPGMPSRVVTISATDITEGGQSLAGQMVRFALSDSLDVTSGGDVIAKTQAEVVLDANGEGSIRLPVYNPSVKTWCGSEDWAILVTATWGSQKAIRVPVGTSSIALSALPSVRPLRGREKQWAVTGASVTVVEGGNAGGTVSLSGGMLDFRLTIPRGDWSRGTLTAGDDANAVTLPGTYKVASSQAANTPGPLVGELAHLGHTSYPLQVFTSWESIPQMFARRQQAGVWSAWEPMTLRRMNAISGEDLNDSRALGFKMVLTGTVKNGPGAVGTLITAHEDVQMFLTREATPRMLVRSYTGGAWGPWAPIGGGSADLGDLPDRVAALEASPTTGGVDTGIHQHLMRETDMRQRLGRVSTGGKAAVCLIFDHGTAKFESIVLPLLRQHQMRATLALNGGMFDAGYMHAATNGTATWDTIKAWATGDGIEIANHTMTHRGATGPDAMRAEIIGGREALEAALGFPVDSFVQIGVPSGDPDYDSFGIGSSPSAYYSTVAGRMILDAHACITGSIPHTRQTYGLDGMIPLGANGRWLDAGTPEAITSVWNRIDGAVQRTERTIVRLHPAAIDLPNSVTTAVLTEFLAQLAARRDAGDLVVMPFREWSIATV